MFPETELEKYNREIKEYEELQKSRNLQTATNICVIGSVSILFASLLTQTGFFDPLGQGWYLNPLVWFIISGICLSIAGASYFIVTQGGGTHNFLSYFNIEGIFIIFYYLGFVLYFFTLLFFLICGINSALS